MLRLLQELSLGTAQIVVKCLHFGSGRKLDVIHLVVKIRVGLRTFDCYDHAVLERHWNAQVRNGAAVGDS